MAQGTLPPLIWDRVCGRCEVEVKIRGCGRRPWGERPIACRERSGNLLREGPVAEFWRKSDVHGGVAQRGVASGLTSLWARACWRRR